MKYEIKICFDDQRWGLLWCGYFLQEYFYQRAMEAIPQPNEKSTDDQVKSYSELCLLRYSVPGTTQQSVTLVCYLFGFCVYSNNMEIGAISVLLKNKMWDSVMNVLKGIKPEVCPETYMNVIILFSYCSRSLLICPVRYFISPWCSFPRPVCCICIWTSSGIYFLKTSGIWLFPSLNCNYAFPLVLH